MLTPVENVERTIIQQSGVARKSLAKTVRVRTTALGSAL